MRHISDSTRLITFAVAALLLMQVVCCAAPSDLLDSESAERVHVGGSSTVSNNPAATPRTGGGRFTNTLGMQFVRVPGTDLYWSIWETRVDDYRQFVSASGRPWPNPRFEQGPTHPAVMVSWNDAKAFCSWLTSRERSQGKLPAGLAYRLPTDVEWSQAVGMEAEAGTWPLLRSGLVAGQYPWGRGWPPLNGAGNYGQPLGVDVFEFTSPCGSFEANPFGLFDMGGNVSEWCADAAAKGMLQLVHRGGHWRTSDEFNARSSCRFLGKPDHVSEEVGFRSVLASESKE